MSSEANSEVATGIVLEGKYRLQDELGVGGMGQVFRAEHETIERTVAIKVLHQDLASDESVRRRFEREAKAIARLKHRNCVMLYEFGFSDEIGALFAVFEYVEGRSLEHWIGQQLPIGDVLELGRQVAAGMDHAHEQKIVHRDLKPENIMVVPADDGPIMKVLDFGIARIVGDDDQGTRLTKMGQMFGTPPYMSPEQVRAQLDVTTAADIYSIGVMLYELTEGRLPFLGDTPISTAMSHLEEEPPPMERDDVPEALKTIITRCLEKEPEDRFESCVVLKEALEAVQWDRSEHTLLGRGPSTERDEAGSPEDRAADTAETEGADGGVREGKAKAEGIASAPTALADSEEFDGAGGRSEDVASDAGSRPDEETGDDPGAGETGETSTDVEARPDSPDANSADDAGAERKVVGDGDDESRSDEMDEESGADPIDEELAARATRMVDDGADEGTDESAERNRRILAAFASVAALLVLGGVVAILSIDPGGDEPARVEESGEIEPVAAGDDGESDQAAGPATEEGVDEAYAREDTGEESPDEETGTDDEETDEKSEESGESDEPTPDEEQSEGDENTGDGSGSRQAGDGGGTGGEPAPEPASVDPEPDPSSEDSGVDESPAQPDPIELQRRRRDDDQQEDEDDEQQLEEPEGIGLPERD